jgi:transcription elongation factor GreA
MTTTFLTKKGFLKLDEEIQKLDEERRQIVAKIDEARKLGDLSENAEYKAARDEQKINEKKLVEASYIKANCQIITKSIIGDESLIKIGSRIELCSNENQNDKKIIHIVSNYESDINNGFISVETPIAQKLLNRSINEEVKIGIKNYKIIKISYDHLD